MTGQQQQLQQQALDLFSQLLCNADNPPLFAVVPHGPRMVFYRARVDGGFQLLSHFCLTFANGEWTLTWGNTETAEAHVVAARLGRVAFGTSHDCASATDETLLAQTRSVADLLVEDARRARKHDDRCRTQNRHR